MRDGRDSRTGYDKDGNSWVTDSNGEYVKDHNGNKIPGRPEQIDVGSGWVAYDTSRGHCGLCGRLTCNGGCFK